MPKVPNNQDILSALQTDDLAEAQRLIEIRQREQGHSADLFYLQGKLRMKHSQWGEAISCFLRAEELDPESPARECRLMLNEIMAFYNKDMYNQ